MKKRGKREEEGNSGVFHRRDNVKKEIKKNGNMKNGGTKEDGKQ